MEFMFGLEVPVPHGPDVFEMVGAQVGLTCPLLHLTNVCRRAAYILGRQWSEFLVTRHGPPRIDGVVANVARIQDASGCVLA